MNIKTFTSESIELMQGCLQLAQEHGLEPIFDITTRHLVMNGVVSLRATSSVSFFYTDRDSVMQKLASIDRAFDQWIVQESTGELAGCYNGVEEVLNKVRQMYITKAFY